MKNDDYPEFAVTREKLSAFFSPPLAKSTFYDLVNRGKIFPVAGVRGYYRLNASLRKLGMPPVKELTQPKEALAEPSGSSCPTAERDQYPAVFALLDHYLQRQMTEGWLTPLNWDHGWFPDKRALNNGKSLGRALFPEIFS